MIYLLISLLGTISIMMLFKLFGRYKIDNLQAIVVNYWTCVTTGLLTMEGNINLSNQPFWSEPWFPFTLFIGANFLFGFFIMAVTTQRVGIAVTTIAAKTSMVMLVIASFFLFNDSIGISKIIGIGLALAAVFLTAIKEDDEFSFGFNKYLILPIIVFVTSGLIEIILAYVKFHHLDNSNNTLFTIISFGVPAVFGLLILTFRVLTKRTKLGLKHILAGIILGIPNYFSIYCLIMAISYSGLESSVLFPLVNTGVVIGSTLMAFIVFKEPLSKINWLGVGFAIAAIILIAQ